MASLPPGHAHLRFPPRGLPLGRAHLHIPVNLAVCPGAYLISEPFPLALPGAALLLASTLIPEGAAEALSLRMLWGWAEQSGWGWGPSHLPLPSPGSLLERGMQTGSGCTEHLPSQPHAREPQTSRLNKQPCPGPFPPAYSSSISQIPDLPEEMLFGQHLGAGVAI